MNSRSLYLAAAAIAFGVVACDSTTAPLAGFDQTDANQLASDVDAVAVLALGDVGATSLAPSYSLSPADATPLASVNAVNRSFTNTHPCPVSGSVTVAGTTVGTSDPVAHNLSVTTTATRTDAACAFNTKHGVATITGNPNVAMTATVNVVAGKPTGVQTQSHKGSFTWSRDGKTGTCAVDVTSAFDPAAGTFTVTGTMCGRTINISRTGPKFP
jgi:hypothetical protein